MLFGLLAALLLTTQPDLTPLVEYRGSNEVASERISLFAGGDLVLHQQGPQGRELMLRRLLSPEEMETYRLVLRSIEWERVTLSSGAPLSGPLCTSYEVHVRLNGRHHRFRATTLDVLSHDAGRLMQVVDDLRRILMEKTGEAGPFVTRTPVPGDTLVDTLGRTFSVVLIREEDGIYVLEGVDVPLRYELSLEQLKGLFRGYADSGR